MDTQYCKCGHPNSDHREGHCNGFKDRTALGDTVRTLREEELCPCKRFEDTSIVVDAVLV